jgi:hypothetical protein
LTNKPIAPITIIDMTIRIFVSTPMGAPGTFLFFPDKGLPHPSQNRLSSGLFFSQTAHSLDIIPSLISEKQGFMEHSAVTAFLKNV